MRYIRLERLAKPHWAVVEGDTAYILKGDPYIETFMDGRRPKFDRCSLLPPCEASRVVCVTQNAEGVAPAFEVREEPVLLAHNQEIQLPDGEEHLSFGGGMAVVMRAHAEKVKAAEAFGCVLGVTCFNDMMLGEGEDAARFTAIGPVASDEVDPGHLTIRARVNGEVVAESGTDKLAVDLAGIIEAVTAAVALEPGDVILTGSCVAGTVKRGDAVEVELEGVGVLKNTVM